MTFLTSCSWRIWLYVAICILVLQAVILWYVGQPAICECGYIKIWEGVVLGPGNSQHFTDWYTFSHIIHGFIFYAVLWVIFPRTSWVLRLALAIGLEAAWEILENSPMIIDRYRQTALAQGYTGDSILNSISDTLAMVGGFILARKWPISLVVGIALAMEVFTGYVIRDNLALNIVALVHPIEVISDWQLAK